MAFTLKEMVKLAINGVSKEDALKYDGMGLDSASIIEAKKNNIDIDELASVIGSEESGDDTTPPDGTGQDGSGDNDTGEEGDQPNYEELYNKEVAKTKKLQEQLTRQDYSGGESEDDDELAKLFREWR